MERSECVDLTKLNAYVKIEFHMLPTVDYVLAQLNGAKMMSKLDANSWYWQILYHISCQLTTFITPFGTFQFNHLPFGIISVILENQEWVICMLDGILVYWRNQSKHDKWLKVILKRIQAAGITLNLSKCEISKTSLKFLGHSLSIDGLRPDQDRVLGVYNFPTPNNIRVIGF